jgi:hypothetical protein
MLKQAGERGMSRAQTAAFMGIDLNDFIREYYSNQDWRLSYETGVTLGSNLFLEIIAGWAKDESPQGLKAACYMHQHYVKIHQEAAMPAIKPASNQQPGAPPIEVTAMDTMKSIVEDYKKRVEMSNE